MRKVITIISLVLLANLLVVSLAFASAQDTAMQGLDDTNQEAGLAPGDPAATVGAALSVLLSILGIIFLIVVIYGGITWMTAGGNEENVSKGRKMLIEGTIGLIICLAAYSFTVFVVARVGDATGNVPTGEESGAPAGGGAVEYL
jgi:hypothetical protein